MIKFTLVFQSLLNRWLSCLLIILTLAFSISLYFTVSRIQESVKASFKSTVSGVDSVVAARGGNLQILLNSVFLIGEPSAPIQWNTYQDIANNNKIKWAVPISLGDSHKGYRVIGTTNDYFKQIKYDKENISFLKKNNFSLKEINNFSDLKKNNFNYLDINTIFCYQGSRSTNDRLLGSESDLATQKS